MSAPQGWTAAAWLEISPAAPLSGIVAATGADTADAVYAAGRLYVRGVTQQALAAAAATTPAAPPPRREISKLVVVDRLEAAGLGDVADAALTGQAKRRWNAATSLYVDDPDVVGFLQAIGADPDLILARE